MLRNVFTNNSLVLVKCGKIIYSSKYSGLRPLYECVKKYKGKHKGLTLYDKVVGLASARLIVYSSLIFEVITTVISVSAKKLLEDNNISIKAAIIVKNILNKEKSFTCPMEVRAEKISSNEEFFHVMRSIFEITLP